MKHSAVKRILVLAAALLLAASSLVLAKGPQGIRWTPHNLSATGTATYATLEEQICIFCHTPHGGTLDGPLWNRNLGGTSFNHYTSTTLTVATSNATRPVNTESLLCLSCHDGSLATNRVINPSSSGQPENIMQGAGVEVEIQYMFGPGSVIGATNAGFATTELTDDHPISFSYYDAEGDASETGLHTTGDVLAMAEGPRFFGAGETPGGMRVECSTCHDPHVDYAYAFMPGGVTSGSGDANYTPFLIMPNTGSNLCLACHNK